MIWNLFNAESGWYHSELAWNQQPTLFWFGATIMLIQAWMVVEGVLLLPKVKGVLEESLPKLPAKQNKAAEQ